MKLIIKKRNKVFLIRRNIKTRRPSAKLDHLKLGPFKIKRKIERLNYKLELLKIIEIHFIFYIALLELAPDLILVNKVKNF